MAIDTQDPFGDGLGMMGAEIYGMTPAMDPYDFTTATEVHGATEGEKPTEELQARVTALLQEAQSHYEEYIAPDQVMATDYYYGRPFGDEREGRSQVVSTDVRDAILDRHPDLLEIFFAGDRVIEFKPRGPEDVAQAQLQTDYVNYCFIEDNPGFLILNAVLKDMGVRRLGYTKWWWESMPRIHGETLFGLTEQELMVLQQDSGLEGFEIVNEHQLMVPGQDPETGEIQMAPVPVFDVEIRRVEPYGAVRVAAIPPEEIIWTPDSRSLGEAAIVAHRREMPSDEVVGLGVKPEDVERFRGQAHLTTASSDDLRWSRSFYGVSNKSAGVSMDNTDDARAPVLFTEAYALVDADGDGISELRMFKCLGESYEIVNGPLGELVDEIPIAVFTEDPEPHTILGLCAWDHTKSIQRVNSQIERASLNSLALAVEPQMEVGPGVNPIDLISPEISGVVRVRSMGSIREIKTTFVGAECLEMLAFYNQKKSDRLGVVGPREGVDPNIMQSTTAEAVESTLSKAQKRIKVIARVVAETGMKTMFKGILRLLVQHKNEWAGRQVRLNNQWVEIDPRPWDADMDVTMNVALGTGSKSAQLAQLGALAAKQEEHIQMGSPLTSFVELRATYASAMELMGYKDAARAWKPWGVEQQQQFEQAQAQKPSSDPAMELVKVEGMKAQAQIAIEDKKAESAIQVAQVKARIDAGAKAAELKLKREEMLLENDREKDKIARDTVLKERELELKHKADIHDAELRAQIQRDRQAQTPQE